MAPQHAPYDQDTELAYNNAGRIADESIPDSVWKPTNKVHHIVQRLGKDPTVESIKLTTLSPSRGNLQRKAGTIATEASSPFIIEVRDNAG